jgi:hypothetical protein
VKKKRGREQISEAIKADPSMDWDKWLVQEFVEGLNKATAREYELLCHPDMQTGHEREQKKAVEAIYRDVREGRLAIEHTRVEAFLDMLTYENKIFGEVWKPLKLLPLPEYFIWLRVPFDWLGKDCSRQERREAASVVKDWFLRERQDFPVGESSYDIANSLMPLRVGVDKRHYGPEYPGQVSIASWDVKFGDPFQLLVSRVTKAVKDKLGKLIATDADYRRVLLIEIVEQNLCTV